VQIDIGPGKRQRFVRDAKPTPPGKRKQRATLKRGESIQHQFGRFVAKVGLPCFIYPTREKYFRKRVVGHDFGRNCSVKHLGTPPNHFARMAIGNR
jgi:hypothetical protein